MNDQTNSIVAQTILIIEDDVSILRGLKDNLSFEGYNVLTSADGQEGLQIAIENHINLLLLDIMLPGINGYDICRRLKKEKPELPIIMITARGSEIDKIAGLDLGADDYLYSIPTSAFYSQNSTLTRTRKFDVATSVLDEDWGKDEIYAKVKVVPIVPSADTEKSNEISGWF